MNSLTFMDVFFGRLWVLVNLFDVFHGCQHQFMSVLWFLSVRMKKQDFSHFDGCFMVFVSENGKTGFFSL